MNEFIEIFQKIYVINLVSRGDRRREMDRQLRRIGLSLGAWNVELFPAVRPADPAGFPSTGARGCFLSHLSILRKASASGLQTILIFEDDLNFIDAFDETAAPVAQRLRQLDWALFYGGYRLEREPAADKLGCAVASPDDEVDTTHFVGIRGPAIASLVAYFDAQLARPSGHPDGGPMHVDGSYNWYRRANPELGTLLAVPQLGYQRASRTDIHELRLRDRFGATRMVMSLLRRLKNH